YHFCDLIYYRRTKPKAKTFGRSACPYAAIPPGRMPIRSTLSSSRRGARMIVEPTNKSVTELKGLHLFHADISNCSMRVRMALAEKALPWTSHHLDLRKKETVTPEYFGIHPKGLVPTLVHDGVVHIESNEIIEYLDETFPDPPLQPRADRERQ